jgi:transcriptional regulator with XRE-family HTH domain
MAVPTADYTAAYALLRELLKKAREAKGISQSQLAKKLDVPQSYVSKYETGERRLDLVETLEVCVALDTDTANFIREFQKRVAKPQPRKRTR